MAENIPPQIRKQMFRNIKKDLEERLAQCVYPSEIAATFNSIFFNHFMDPAQKRTKDPQFSLNPVFFGQYFIDPTNPIYTRPFSYQGTIGCTELSLTEGVIAHAIRNGKRKFAPDVTKEKDHVQCDETMTGSELVIPTWSDPYSYGPNRGYIIPFAVLDIDVNIKNAFTEKEIDLIEKLWRPVGKRIFPGSPSFQPNESIYKELYEGTKNLRMSNAAYKAKN